MSLLNIFQKPREYESFGKLYPIRMKDWDEFEDYVQILMLSNAQFEGDDGSPLFRKLVAIGSQNNDLIFGLQNLFNLVTRTSTFTIKFEGDDYWFSNDKGQIVNEFNYDELRKVILHQNLLIEPKIFKNKLMQEWADKVLKARQKDSANVTLEDMITSVAALSGKDYEKLSTYSIYQLKSEFYRWQQIKSFDAMSNLYGNPYAASEVKLPQFAEYLDLYADPYKDVFKSDKGMNITQAFK